MKHKRKPKQSRTWWLYVLKCEKDRWFVGITTDLEWKYKQHQRGLGGTWTNKYRPIKIAFKKDLGDVTTKRAQEFQGRITRVYMEKYGDANVRCDDIIRADIPVRRFDTFFTKYDWETFVLIMALVAMIVYLIIDKANSTQTQRTAPAASQQKF